MKTLYFFENGNEEELERLFSTTISMLDAFSDVDTEKLNFVKIPNLGRMPKTEFIEIVSNKNNVIFTFSVYRGVSENQLLNTLDYFGREDFENHIYVDMTGKIDSCLRTHFLRTNFINDTIIRAINKNIIVTLQNNPVDEWDKKFCVLEMPHKMILHNFNVSLKQLLEI